MKCLKRDGVINMGKKFKKIQDHGDVHYICNDFLCLECKATLVQMGTSIIILNLHDDDNKEPKTGTYTDYYKLTRFGNK